LRDVREAAGFSQGKLARKARTTQSTISKLEDGRTESPSHAVVQRICRALGVDWSEIIEFRVSNGGAE
jgi:transcriptional regulator with XRE-family HTH domain